MKLDCIRQFYCSKRSKKAMEHVERGQDLESLIRENQLLRLSNRRLTHLCQNIISLCSSKVYELLPQIPPFDIDSNDISKVMNSFAAYLDKCISQQIESRHQLFESKLAQYRQTIINLQQKVQQYQCTISEMSLIIQKLEMELQDKRMNTDTLQHEILRERIQKEKVEENEAKWKGRYQYVLERLESARDEGRMATQRHNFDIYS